MNIAGYNQHSDLTQKLWTEFTVMSYLVSGPQNVSTFRTRQIQLSYLLCIKYFGLPISVSWRRRSVVLWCRSIKDVHFFCEFRMTFT